MANTSTQHQQKLHAIFMAYPLQGHVIPAVYLAIKLASKGFTITFINTQYIHHQISKAAANNNHDDNLFAAACKSGLDIRYYTVTDGFPLEFDRSVKNVDQFGYSLLHDLSAHVEHLLQKIIPSSDPPITCFIADTLLAWPSMIAKKFNLFYISLWTEPALVFTLYYYMDLLKKNGHFGPHDKQEDIIDYIPGVAAIKPTDLMSWLQETDVITMIHKMIFTSFEDVKGADFVLCNTVQELEPDTISALQVEKPFYAIGPIFPTGFPKRSVATSFWAESDCTQWLDNKPNGSVLYVSFGSLAHVTKHDIIEIAYGLLLSKVNFIWVSSDNQNPLPDEFLEECRDRGMVVPWCNQIQVLSHSSVGGFFTHCGWNSILESIWCGIPFLCFPIWTDQLTNRKLIVDDWKIGLDINPPKKPVIREEVSEKISSLMSGKSSEELKINIMGIKKTFRNAISADGSSEKNLDMFIDELTAQICKKNEDTT